MSKIKNAEQLARHNATTIRSRRKLIAQNPDRLCPPEHKHGLTSNCVINHGCRCESCLVEKQKRRNIPEWHARRMKGQNVRVSAVGSRRRLQALAFMGWSTREVGKLIDSHYRPLLKLRSHDYDKVTLSTHNKIAAVYKKLALTEAPGRGGRITRTNARKNGYHSPLAWGNIDDKQEMPDTNREEVSR